MYYPRSYLVNSTSMIPKVGKDLSGAAGRRPITVGSSLAKMFRALLEVRAPHRGIKLSPSKKASFKGTVALTTRSYSMR